MIHIYMWVLIKNIKIEMTLRVNQTVYTVHTLGQRSVHVCRYTLAGRSIFVLGTATNVDPSCSSLYLILTVINVSFEYLRKKNKIYTKCRVKNASPFH